MKEITLTEVCPGCWMDAMIENPLKQQPGGFTGFYCIRPGSATNEKGHVYSDTGELRQESAKVTKFRKAKAKEAVAKVIPLSEEITPKEATPEVISTIEPKAFEVTELDAGRLSEILGQPITDGGTLVGACYSLKMTTTVEQGVAQRQAASVSAIGTEIPIDQKRDGQLRVQIFLPWAVGRSMVEKAIFNGITLQEVVQNLLEYVMQSTFPWNTTSTPDIDPSYNGFWMVIVVPELYVGTLMDQAVTMGMTPTEYMQSWIYDAVRMEQLQ